MAKVIDLGAF